MPLQFYEFGDISLQLEGAYAFERAIQPYHFNLELLIIGKRLYF
jgi:hypothetical protein